MGLVFFSYYLCAFFACFQQDLWKPAFPVGVEVYYSEESVWLQQLLFLSLFTAQHVLYKGVLKVVHTPTVVAVSYCSNLYQRFGCCH